MSNQYDRPDIPDELDKLDIFTGTWESQDTHESMEWMPEGGTGTTREFFRRALDNYCFLTDVESITPFGNVKGHGITFYDNTIKKFCLQWYDNFGNHITGEGNCIDETTYVLVGKYTMNGKTIIERHTDKLMNENEKNHTIETLIDGEFKKTSELIYKRVGD